MKKLLLLIIIIITVPVMAMIYAPQQKQISVLRLAFLVTKT
jgi:hypothetical protein